MFPLVVNLSSENLFPGARRQLPAQEGRHCVHPSDGCENFRILEFTDIWEQTNALSSKLVKSWFFHQSCSQVTEEGGTWTIKTSTTLKTMELKFKVRNIFQRLHHTLTYDKDKDIDVHHLEDHGAQVQGEEHLSETTPHNDVWQRERQRYRRPQPWRPWSSSSRWRRKTYTWLLSAHLDYVCVDHWSGSLAII